MGLLFNRNRHRVIGGGSVLPPYTPVATSFAWQTQPSAVGLYSISATGNVLAQVLDQHLVPMSPQPSINYSSGTTTNITVSGNTLTAVANGTSLITATTSGFTNLTGTASVSQVLASISISPTSPTVPNGTAQVFTASGRDANAQTMSAGAGTWVSSDPTDFPINSSTGSCTPNVDSGSAVIKFTNTATGIFGTTTITATSVGGAPVIGPSGQNIMGAVSTAVPLRWDAARVYNGSGFASPDAQWHYNKFQNNAPAVGDNYYFNPASPTLGGQAAGAALYKYGDSINIDLVNVVTSSILPLAIPAFRFIWKPNTGNPGDAAQGQSPPSAQMNTIIGTTPRRVWMGRRIAHATAAQIAGANKWDATASEDVLSANITYNTSGGGAGAGLKHGPFVGSSSVISARAGIEGGNAYLDGSGHMGMQYDLDNYFVTGGGAVGPNDTPVIDTTLMDGMFYDGLTYDEVILVELITDPITSHDSATIRFWHRNVNSDYSVGSWRRIGCYSASTMFDGTTWYDGFVYNTISFTSKNHNRAIEVPRYRDISEWAAFDADNPNSDGSNDPWACLTYDAAKVPSPLTSATLTSTAVGSALFSLQRTTIQSTPSFAGKIRMVINGVDNSSSSDYVIPAILDDRTAFNFTWTQSPGTYNVAFKTVSADGSQVSTTYPSTPISVTIPASLIPLTPTQTNATASKPNSLTFPVTLNTSGALPTNLAWQYSKDGGTTWISGIDIVLTSPTLGQVVTVIVPCNAPAQLYNVKFAEKNGSGTSTWSSATTGTTSTSANTARSNLILSNSTAPFKPTILPASLSSVLPLGTNGVAPSANWFGVNGANSPTNPYVIAPGGASVSTQWGGWVSEGLKAGTVPSGTYTMAVNIFTEGGGSFLSAFSIKIWRPLTRSIVGTIYDSATGIGSAVNTGSAGGKVIALTGSSVVVQDGDVLVIEQFAVGTGSGTFLHLYFGGPGAVTEGSNVISFEQCSIAFPSNITFQV